VRKGKRLLGLTDRQLVRLVPLRMKVFERQNVKLPVTDEAAAS
jgi:hypothetical protein